jgi:hypothetical protein
MEGYRRSSRDHFVICREYTHLQAASVCELSVTLVFYHKLWGKFLSGGGSGYCDMEDKNFVHAMYVSC